MSKNRKKYKRNMDGLRQALLEANDENDIDVLERNAELQRQQWSTEQVEQYLLKGNIKEALFEAIKGSNLDALKRCVEQGADVKGEGTRIPPLHYAVWHRCNTELITYLVEQGADINGQSLHGVTVIGVFCYTCPYDPGGAYMRPSLEILHCLIRLGVDINAYCCGETLLHVVARNRDLETAEFLIDNGANVNAVSHYYPETLLQIAIERNSMDSLAECVDDSLLVTEYGVYGVNEDGLPSKCFTEEIDHQCETEAFPAFIS